MAISLPFDAADGYLSFCVNPVADESTTGASWTSLGYVTGFSINKKKNKRAIYDHKLKTCSKDGKLEYSGKIDQLYTRYAEGVAKLCDDDQSIALKFVIDPGDTGTPVETYYFSIVDLDNLAQTFGDTANGGDQTLSCDFTFSNNHVV